MTKKSRILILLTLLSCGGGKDTIQITLNCDENTNSGNAVVITLYQLINSDKFRLSSFEYLAKNPVATLGTDLITNSELERTMVPGESLELNEIEIKQESAFIGIIADFNSPAPDGWRAIIPITKDLKQLVILIHENSISVQKKD
jgi:type VI secretion system VasD/TssJ family lipoprotein